MACNGLIMDAAIGPPNGWVGQYLIISSLEMCLLAFEDVPANPSGSTPLLKCGKILCQVRPSVFLRRLKSKVKIEHHRNTDACPTRSTLLLHEDILARTLAHEQDLRQRRIAKL
jgi:hypothetical protein